MCIFSISHTKNFITFLSYLIVCGIRIQVSIFSRIKSLENIKYSFNTHIHIKQDIYSIQVLFILTCFHRGVLSQWWTLRRRRRRRRRRCRRRRRRRYERIFDVVRDGYLDLLLVAFFVLRWVSLGICAHSYTLGHLHIVSGERRPRRWHRPGDCRSPLDDTITTNYDRTIILVPHEH